MLLARAPIDLLGRCSIARHPGSPVSEAGWNGITLAIDVGSESELHAGFVAAVAAGATTIVPVTRRACRGMSADLADPEGNRWELTVGSEPTD